jgi:Na+/proline symporter
LIANTLLILGIGNYLLAQLMAMGHVIAGLTDQAVPYWAGVIVLTLVIIVYETMGGMRAVAWTDAMQGIMLLLGIAGIIIAAVPGSAHLRETTEWILSQQPERVVVPDWSLCATWVSSVLLIGFSGAVYPHAIQRIYAAESARTLRRSLSVMIFMPLVTTFPMFLIGILSIRRFTNLGGVEADQVMPMLLRQWSSESTWMYAMAILVVVGTVAAIMSTADSVLLSISSILAKDFVGKRLLVGASEARLTRAGKVLSWAVMLVLVPVALAPRITLWGLIELKMEILAQVSPLFLLGLTWKRLTTRAAFAGMIAGTLVAGGLFLGGYRMVAGLHAGVIGWCVNLTLSVALSLIWTGESSHQRKMTHPPLGG